MTAPAGYVPVSNLGAGADGHTRLREHDLRGALSQADDRRHLGVALPVADTHAHRALPAEHRAGRRILRQDMVRGDLGSARRWSTVSTNPA